MRMTDTTLKNTFLGVNPASAALGTAAGTQRASEKTQDFGAVLDKTAQKYDKPEQTTSDNGAKSTAQQTAETQSVKEEKPVQDTAETVDEKASVADETVEKAAKEPAGAIAETEEPVEEMTVDEIAKALEQIIEQIKQILGITDEELLGGMEALGLQPYDLLETGNMAQLVTAIAGQDSPVSLIANEDLYTALQDITKMVETQVSNLLEDTGLTGEELEAVLQKLQEPADQTAADQQQSDSLFLAGEQDETALSEMPEVKEASEGPVIVKEDQTKSEAQDTKQYEQLPENQQENPVEVGTKPQSAGRDAKEGDSSEESRDFGQNNTAHNVQNNLSEVNTTAAAEGVEKFTSESTENIMRQLADMVKIVRNESLTEMELQLHPASLGTVNVSLTTKGGMVTAEFTTQNEAVKAAIEAQASQLRANLEEQGVKIEAIEVSVESHQMEHELDKNGDRQQKQSQEQETERIQGLRRGRSSINLRAFMNEEELEGEMQGADDATRIAMEIMAANGNTMDLLV